MKEKLVVMDYSDNSVTIYNNIDSDASTEDLLKERGHNLENCIVMFTDNLSIKYGD